MDIPPTVGRNGEGMTAGGRYLHLPPPEHSRTVHYDWDQYLCVSGSIAETKAKSLQAVVKAGQGGCGGDLVGGSGGGTDGRRGGGVGGEILGQWEDNVVNLTLGTEHNSSLLYSTRLDHRHPIIITLGGPGCRLERDIEILH